MASDATRAAIAEGLAKGLTRREAADAAGCSPSTLFRELRKGDLRSVLTAAQATALDRVLVRLAGMADAALAVLDAELRAADPDPASPGRIRAAQATLAAFIDARERLNPTPPSATNPGA